MAEGYVPFSPFAGWVPTYDGSLVDELAVQLQDARARYGDVVADRAVEVASRYAAVDTGAIEGLYTTNRGFTRTIAERSANWEAALAAHPEAEHHIRDALDGYEFVLDAVTGAHPITQAWIRELHAVLLASQETHHVSVAVADRLHRQARPLVKGAYKTERNFPTNPDSGVVHHYAPVDDTPAEMGRLVAELTMPDFLAAHPVVQAAYAHYAFVCVHPFADGNGRVARALASVFLYRQPGIPLVIFADQTPAYLDALAAADGGRPAAFVMFVEQRAIDAGLLVVAEMATLAGTRNDLAAALQEEVSVGSVPTGPRWLAERLHKLLVSCLSEELALLSLPEGVTHDQQPAMVGLKGAPSPEATTAPVRATLCWGDAPGCWAQVIFQVGVVTEAWSPGGAPSERSPVLRVWSGPDRVAAELDIWRHDVHPTVSQAFEHRLRAWVRGRLQALVSELALRIREQRAEQGG